VLNNLDFKKINYLQFPLAKLLNKMPKYNSLYETAIITVNDYYVNLFLKKKIDYFNMIYCIKKILNVSKIKKYKNIQVKNVDQILNFKKELSFKLNNIVYKK
jgi:1-deoxy-D-xylulose 5-phosphate reductoisomerase